MKKNKYSVFVAKFLRASFVFVLGWAILVGSAGEAFLALALLIRELYFFSW